VRYLSVCSGIEAASVAWHPLGWEPAAFCEIEAFPSAVLAHRYPNVPNYGDFTRLTDAAHPIHDAGIDLLVGGTPCQAFSVAGLRQGLADARGGLALEYVRLARALSPRWLLWENVPGVLSSGQGRDFGAFIGALVESGYGVAWRVLDAQYVRVDGYAGAVQQRRKRVFVVGCAGGDAARAAAVLFEPEGVRGLRASRRGEAGEGKAASAFARSDEVDSGVLCRQHEVDWDECGCWCIDDMRCPWCDEWTSGLHSDPVEDCLSCCGAWLARTVNTLSDGAHRGGGLNGQDGNSGRILVDNQGRVRRLTPSECEKLQGFSGEHTLVPYKGKPATECPDGPRYKALGNSMACNVMRWIGTRIAMVDAVGGGA